MSTRIEIIKEQVESFLISEGVSLSDKDKALKSLSGCVAESICKKVYLERILNA